MISNIITKQLKLIKKVTSPNFIYLFVNIYVSFVGFIRSFVFMKQMNMEDLGLISLVQTAILFISLFQFGLINGGYRIFALDKVDEQRNINNLLFTFFGLIAGITTLFWVVVTTSRLTLPINNGVLLVSLLCGVFSLMMNWLTNTLIGKRLITNLNKINLISASCSLAVLPLIMLFNVSGAILSLLIQPFLFVGITLFRHKELRPTNWNFDIKQAKYILRFGFIPFLAGIFLTINIQIERWSIAEVLGNEALGKFYLIFIYSSLFTLIPASLLNIFFPKAIYAYENRNIEDFRKILLKHLFFLIVYLIIVSIITIVFLQFTIDWLLPKHSQNTVYVFLYLPGLFAIGLCDSYSIIFNSTVRLRPMLISGVLSVILTCVLLYTIYQLDMFSLKAIAIFKCSMGIITFVYYTTYLGFRYKSMISKCY